MGVIKTVSSSVRNSRLLPLHRLLELYPPFFFMGVKVRPLAPDYAKMRVELPLRWYGKNIHGTMFGGFMAAVSDPIPALMCGEVFPGVEVWSKTQTIDFLRPAKTEVRFDVEISEADREQIRLALEADGKVTHVFQFTFVDRKGREIAKVQNTVFLRARRPHGS